MGAPCCLYRRSPRWGSKNQKFYKNNFIFGYGEREPQIGPREPKKKKSKKFWSKKKRLVKKKYVCWEPLLVPPVYRSEKKKFYENNFIFGYGEREPQKGPREPKKKKIPKNFGQKKRLVKKKISIKYRYRYFYI